MFDEQYLLAMRPLHFPPSLINHLTHTPSSRSYKRSCASYSLCGFNILYSLIGFGICIFGCVGVVMR